MAVNAAGFSPELKLEFIRDQIIAVRAGELAWILCPYCGGENEPVNLHLCCSLFGEASMAIMDRIEKQEEIDFLAELQDNIMGQVPGQVN
jgi:hypothetical protein